MHPPPIGQEFIELIVIKLVYFLKTKENIYLSIYRRGLKISGYKNTEPRLDFVLSKKHIDYTYDERDRLKNPPGMAGL